MTEAIIIFAVLALIVIGYTIFVYFPRKDRFDKKGLTYSQAPWEQTDTAPKGKGHDHNQKRKP